MFILLVGTATRKSLEAIRTMKRNVPPTIVHDRFTPVGEEIPLQVDEASLSALLSGGEDLKRTPAGRPSDPRLTLSKQGMSNHEETNEAKLPVQRKRPSKRKRQRMRKLSQESDLESDSVSPRELRPRPRIVQMDNNNNRNTRRNAATIAVKRPSDLTSLKLSLNDIEFLNRMNSGTRQQQPLTRKSNKQNRVSDMYENENNTATTLTTTEEYLRDIRQQTTIKSPTTRCRTRRVVMQPKKTSPDLREKIENIRSKRKTRSGFRWL